MACWMSDYVTTVPSHCEGNNIIVDFNIDKTIAESYTSNEELAFDASSITGIGCCCGDQRTNETFDARIPPYFHGNPGFNQSCSTITSEVAGKLNYLHHSKENKR